MKFIKGNFGECGIGNCLEAEGQWDLCFTDTLWGKGYDGTKPSGINRKAIKPWVINYDDVWDAIFMGKWFKKFQLLTKAQVVATGWKYFNWWVKFWDPIGIHMVTYNNGQGMTKTAIHGSMSPYVCFGGDWWKKHKFFRSHTQTYIQNGFLNPGRCIHPSPKDYETWVQLIGDLHPKSVVDPFAGSCAIGEVCESLGIKWRGYELEPRYAPLIKERIQLGIERYEKRQRYKPQKVKKTAPTRLF